MKYRKTMPVIVEKDKKYRKKGGRLGHRRITIPVEIREYIEVEKGDFVEWEVDTTKKTLKAKFIKGEKLNKIKKNNIH